MDAAVRPGASLFSDIAYWKWGIFYAKLISTHIWKSSIKMVLVVLLQWELVVFGFAGGLFTSVAGLT